LPELYHVCKLLYNLLQQFIAALIAVCDYLPEEFTQISLEIRIVAEPPDLTQQVEILHVKLLS